MKHCILNSLKRYTATVLCLALFSIPVFAHHSGAMFYNRDGDTITISGIVERFNFANPHAIVVLKVIADDGEVQHWTGETSSPSGLKRRGWTRDSLASGMTITLEGYPALDNSRLMRITRVWLEDGTEVGVPPGISN